MERVYFVERPNSFHGGAVRKMRVLVPQPTETLSAFQEQVLSKARPIGALPSDQLAYWEPIIEDWLEMHSFCDIPASNSKLRLIPLPLSAQATATTIPPTPASTSSISASGDPIPSIPSEHDSPEEGGAGSFLPSGKLHSPDEQQVDARGPADGLNLIHNDSFAALGQSCHAIFTQLVRQACQDFFPAVELPDWNEHGEKLTTLMMYDWLHRLLQKTPLNRLDVFLLLDLTPKASTDESSHRFPDLDKGFQHESVVIELAQALRRMLPNPQLGLVAALANRHTIADLAQVLDTIIGPCQYFIRALSGAECLIVFQQNADYVVFVECWRKRQSLPGLAGTVQNLVPFLPPRKMLLRCPIIKGRGIDVKKLVGHAYTLKMITIEKVLEEQDWLICICDPEMSMKSEPVCKLMDIDFEVFWKDYVIVTRLPGPVDACVSTASFATIGQLQEMFPCLGTWKVAAVCSKTPFEGPQTTEIGPIESAVFGGKACAVESNSDFTHQFSIALKAAFEEISAICCGRFRASLTECPDFPSAEAAAQKAANQVRAMFDTEGLALSPLFDGLEKKFCDEIASLDASAAQVLEECFGKLLSTYFPSSFSVLGGAGNNPAALCDLYKTAYQSMTDNASHGELHQSLKTFSPTAVYRVQDIESTYSEQMQAYPSFMRHRIGIALTEVIESFRTTATEALWKSELAVKDEIYKRRWSARPTEQLHSVGYDNCNLLRLYIDRDKDCASLQNRLELDGCDPSRVSLLCRELLDEIERCYQASSRLIYEITKLLWVPADWSATADDVRAIWQASTNSDADVVPHPRNSDGFVVVPLELAVNSSSSVSEPVNDLLVALNNAQASSPGQRLFHDCHVITPLPVMVAHERLPNSLLMRTDCADLILTAFAAANASVQFSNNTEHRMIISVEDANALLALPNQLMVAHEPIEVEKGKIYMVTFPDSKWTIAQIKADLRAQGYGERVLEVCPWFANEILILVTANASLPMYLELNDTHVICVQRNPGANGLIPIPGCSTVGSGSSSNVQRCLGFWDANYYSQLTDAHKNIDNFIDDLQKEEFRILWQPKAWLTEFKKAGQDRAEMLNVCVALNTLGICQSGQYDATKCGTRCRIDNSLMTVTPYRVQQYLPIHPRFQASGTRVSIVPLDTVAAGMDQLKKGVESSRMVLLDFANAHHAGGGYSHGTTAQEEELFRRSNLALGLDMARFGSGEVIAPLYPMDEYGALIVRSACIFRESSDEGYALIPPVLFNFLVSAAYNAARESFQVVDGDKFSPEGFVRTVRKIYDTIFMAALEHNFDVLILGAIGCGAFGNPAPEVSRIFLELIRCVFAGYFEEIVFAIPDAQGRNFRVFKSALAPTGPVVYRCVDGLTRAHPFDFGSAAKLCHWLADCNDQDDPTHTASFLHPPPCPHGDSCKFDTNSIHCKLFRHFKLCANGKSCAPYFSEDGKVRAAHRLRFKHHDAEMRAPACPDGIQCRKRVSDPIHKQLRCHEAPLCTFKGNCPHFGAARHYDFYLHPFNQPCKHTPFCDSTNDPQHNSQFSHICEFGVHCTEQGDEHQKNSIHIAHHDCLEANCSHVGSDHHPEVHLWAYSHKGILDIRPECGHGARCGLVDDLKHVKEFAHPPKALPPTHFVGHNVYVNLFTEQKRYRPTWFFANRCLLHDSLSKWLQDNTKPAPSEATLRAVGNWMKNFRVVHRCNPATFEKMWRTGNLLSLHCIQTTAADSVKCAELATQHQIIHRMETVHPEAKILLREFAKKITTLEFSIGQTPGLGTFPGRRGRGSGSGRGSKGGSHAAIAELQHSIKRTSDDLRRLMSTEEIEIVHSMIKVYATAIKGLAAEEVGIGYDVDEKYGTNLSVFGVFGPHTLNYGQDPHRGVHLILRPEIIFHPDFWLTPCAVTSYHSHIRDLERPWSCPGSNDDEERERVGREKLHPIDPHFFEYLALEYTVRTSLVTEKDLSTVTFDDVRNWWMKQDAHAVPEAHMPYSVPFSYVERVVMHEDNYKKLHGEIQAQVPLVLGEGSVCTVSDPDVKLVDKEAIKLATQTQPYPRPPAHVFTAVHDSPITVPISADPDDGCWIYIRACGLPYSVMLRGSRGHEVLTIVFTKDRSYITQAIPEIEHTKFLAESTELNHHCHPAAGYFHLIRLKCKQNSIVVKHFGPSLIYCRAQMAVSGKGRVPEEVTSMTFWIPSQPVQFDMVRVITSQKDKLKSPLNEPKQLENRKPAKDTSSSSSSSSSSSRGQNPVSAFVNRQVNKLCEIGGAIKDVVFGTTTLPRCRFGLHCRIAYDPTQRDHKTHVGRFCHVCLYGQSCLDKDDGLHQKQFVHVDKPVCPNDQCSQLEDVVHRAQFHHAKCWDFLIPCRNGIDCPNRASDSYHCAKYAHMEGISYTLTDKGSIVVSGCTAPPTARNYRRRGQ